jgi:hypothetical protein
MSRCGDAAGVGDEAAVPYTLGSLCRVLKRGLTGLSLGGWQVKVFSDEAAPWRLPPDGSGVGGATRWVLPDDDDGGVFRRATLEVDLPMRALFEVAEAAFRSRVGKVGPLGTVKKMTEVLVVSITSDNF